MPIIEAIKRKLEDGKPKEEERAEEISDVELVEPVKPRPKRTKTPRPFKLRRRPVQRHRQTEIATTEIFLKRPRPPVKRAEPVEPPVATPVKEEKKLEVTEDGLAVEPVDLDSLGKVGEEVPLPPDSAEVGEKRVAPPRPHKRPHPAQPRKAHIHHRKTHHARTPTTHHRIADRASPPLPQERIVPVHHQPKRPSKAPYLILVLVLLAVAGGLVYYYGYYLPRKSEKEREERERALEERKKKEEEERRLFDELSKEARSIRTLSDYEEVLASIDDAESRITLPKYKKRLEGLKENLENWFINEAERLHTEILNRYRVALPTAQLSELLSILDSYPERFARDRRTKKWAEKLITERRKVEKTESILEKYEELSVRLRALEREGNYKEALRLLDTLTYSRDEVLETLLKPISADRRRLMRLLEEKDRAEAERRREAMKAYQKLLTTVEELVKKKDFDGAEQAFEEFLRTHPDTEASAKAEARLSSIRIEKRRWTLLTLFDGSSLDNLRIKTVKGFELDEKRLKIEPEEEDALLFCGYDDMRDLNITFEFVLLEGGFRLLLLSRGDDPSTAFSQEVKHPLVQLNEKMKISIETRGRDVAITFLHTNMTLPIRKAPNPSGSFGLLVPKGTKLHILKITAKEE